MTLTSRPNRRPLILAAISIAAIVLGVWLLERPRQGLDITSLDVGTTPATVMRLPDAEGPVVVIAHGFAGSRQLMAAWQLTLARAGYITVSFDFEGHGRNPVPMSGDVDAIEGTTQLLIDETLRVTDAALALPGTDGRVALLGHSMASDIIVRAGIADDRVEALVAISAFSQAITESQPENLLILNGAWEGMLRQEAVRSMAPFGVAEGETAGTPGAGFSRRAMAVPLAEHVTVLYAAPGLVEAGAWLNASFDRPGAVPVARIGAPILLMLFGVVLLALPLARLLPRGDRPWTPERRQFVALAVLPALITPLALSFVETRLLPVLVADYLALHLALYGALVLAGAAYYGGFPKGRGWVWGLVLALYGLLAFGGLLDRYVASFVPHPGRVPVVLAIIPGAILAMLADAVLLEAAKAPLWRRTLARVSFLVSLAIAVALDFERLFFLILILPVIALFYATFGMMGRAVGRRTGSVVAMGLGLGLVLGWALGVSFPMFDPTL